MKNTYQLLVTEKQLEIYLNRFIGNTALMPKMKVASATYDLLKDSFFHQTGIPPHQNALNLEKHYIQTVAIQLGKQGRDEAVITSVSKVDSELTTVLI